MNMLKKQLGQSLVEELQFWVTQSWWIHLVQVHCTQVLRVVLFIFNIQSQTNAAQTILVHDALDK